MGPIEAARAVLARRYPDIGADDDALCADCFASVHVRDGAEWENGHDVCDECASNRLSRTERALTAVLAEADRLTRTLACERGEWAPEGWTCAPTRDCWTRADSAGAAVVWRTPSPPVGCLWAATTPHGGPYSPTPDGFAPTALEAIEACNAKILGAS